MLFLQLKFKNFTMIKKNIFLLSVFLIFSFVNAQSNEILFQRISSLSSEQKVEQYHQSIKNIFNLPHELSYITGTIMLEVNDYKSVYCPNYPEELNVTRDEFDQLLLNWITNFPDEYMTFIRKAYLEIEKYSN